MASPVIASSLAVGLVLAAAVPVSHYAHERIDVLAVASDAEVIRADLDSDGRGMSVLTVVVKNTGTSYLGDIRAVVLGLCGSGNDSAAVADGDFSPPAADRRPGAYVSASATLECQDGGAPPADLLPSYALRIDVEAGASSLSETVRVRAR